MLREIALKYCVNTSRYSTMLAENLVDSQTPEQRSAVPEQLSIEYRKADENSAEEISGINIGEQNSVTDYHQLVTFAKRTCYLTNNFFLFFITFWSQNLSQMLQI